MKKSKIYTGIVLLTVFFSCQQEETSPTPQADCNCDRVMSHTKYSIIGTPQNPTTIYFGEYVTINDCSGVQTNGNWSTNYGDTEPVDGECL